MYYISPILTHLRTWCSRFSAMIDLSGRETSWHGSEPAVKGRSMARIRVGNIVSYSIGWWDRFVSEIPPTGMELVLAIYVKYQIAETTTVELCNFNVKFSRVWFPGEFLGRRGDYFSLIDIPLMPFQYLIVACVQYCPIMWMWYRTSNRTPKPFQINICSTHDFASSSRASQ